MNVKFFNDVNVLPFGNDETELYNKFGLSGLLDDNIYDNPDMLAGHDIGENIDWLLSNDDWMNIKSNNNNHNNNNNNDNHNDISGSNSNDNLMNIKSNNNGNNNNNNNDSNNDISKINSNGNLMNVKSNDNNNNDKREIDSDMESNASNDNSMSDHSNKNDMDMDRKKTHYPRCNTRSRRKIALSQAELDAVCKDIEQKTKLDEMRKQKQKEERIKKKQLRKDIHKYNLQDFNFYCNDDIDSVSMDIQNDSEGMYFGLFGYNLMHNCLYMSINYDIYR